MQSGERIFSNRQLGMRVYIRIVVNGVRIVHFAHKKIWLRACSRTETFLSTNGPLLMGRLTTRVNTY